MDTNVLKPAAGNGADQTRPDAAVAVTGLYADHVMSLLRLAVVMLGDRAAAEDAVQDAFCALYRRWHLLSDQGKALAYVRSALLNRCRSQLRTRSRAQRRALPSATGSGYSASAEDDALLADEHRQVLAALRELSPRQREALVLRFYLGLTEPDIAASMGISAGTVKSTTSRALAALGKLLKEHR